MHETTTPGGYYATVDECPESCCHCLPRTCPACGHDPSVDISAHFALVKAGGLDDSVFLEFLHLAFQMGDDMRFDSSGVPNHSEAATRIVGMGDAVVPYVIAWLRGDPLIYWVWILFRIVRYDFGFGHVTVQGAIDAWIEWWDSL